MSQGLLAFIGGTGFDLRGPDSPFSDPHDERVETRFGIAHVTHAKLDGRPVLFLHRHAQPGNPINKTVPPHKINYRANIAALKRLGVTGILATTAVGCLREEWKPGTLALLDSFLDTTSNREKTFYDTRAVHTDVTYPYCEHLRKLVIDTAESMGIPVQPKATYLCADGPRFETAAEIRTYKLWGADVVGMTGVPEVTLAREAEMSYAGLSIITNAAAGISPNPLSHQEVLDEMAVTLPKVAELFLAAARKYEDDPTISARTAVRGFVGPGYDPIVDEVTHVNPT
jgi:5'-methylthioadenosine phosphorylase